MTAAPEEIEKLLAAWLDAPPNLRATTRISRHFGPWLDRARRERQRSEAAAAFSADLAAGRATLDVLTHPLLPYQRAGAMHLAFGERALLADDMGLGKTIQAIAACELLARSRRNRTRSRRLPGLAEGRVGRTDRPFLRAPRPSRVRTARPAPRRLSRTGLLHDRQLRTGARRRRRHKRPNCSRTSSCWTRRNASRTGRRRRRAA